MESLLLSREKVSVIASSMEYKLTYLLPQGILFSLHCLSNKASSIVISLKALSTLQCSSNSLIIPWIKCNHFHPQTLWLWWTIAGDPGHYEEACQLREKACKMFSTYHNLSTEDRLVYERREVLWNRGSKLHTDSFDPPKSYTIITALGILLEVTCTCQTWALGYDLGWGMQ